MSRGLIDVRWPTQSMGFTDTRKDIEKGDWDLRQLLSSKICGLDTDQDLMRTDKPLGFFTPNLAAPSLPDEVLPHTASTEDVEALQNALNAKAAAGLTVDGQYGPATTGAVMAFQKAHGLTVDGVAGIATISTLKGLA
jgi:murein L,D-transpeptidase YcbB/YkuD